VFVALPDTLVTAAGMVAAEEDAPESDAEEFQAGPAPAPAATVRLAVMTQLLGRMRTDKARRPRRRGLS
jgi:hypothetical protein